jgi:hypothetical protein
MLEWKEREHDNDDMVTLHDPQVRESLWNCRLLKYFKIQNILKEILLLKHLIGLWDTDEKAFFNVPDHQTPCWATLLHGKILIFM